MHRALLAVVAAALSCGACVRAPDRTLLEPVETAPEPPADGVRGSRIGSRRPAVASWTGRSMDGAVVTVTEDAVPPGVWFVGDRPWVVAHVDKLARAADCRGLADQWTWWRLEARTGSEHADVASAFAQYAADVALYIGCSGVVDTADG